MSIFAFTAVLFQNCSEAPFEASTSVSNPSILEIPPTDPPNPLPVDPTDPPIDPGPIDPPPTPRDPLVYQTTNPPFSVISGSTFARNIRYDNGSRNVFDIFIRILRFFFT